jgi:Fe-S cluster assembly scaffold protein SufB
MMPKKNIQIQNWYPKTKKVKGGVYNFVTKRGFEKNAKISWTSRNRFHASLGNTHPWS